jgi:hypothetical protein
LPAKFAMVITHASTPPAPRGEGSRAAEMAARIASGPGFWADWLAELDRQGLLEELLAEDVIARALREAPPGHKYDRVLTARMTVICVLVACLFPGAGYDIRRPSPELRQKITGRAAPHPTLLTVPACSRPCPTRNTSDADPLLHRHRPGAAAHETTPGRLSRHPPSASPMPPQTPPHRNPERRLTPGRVADAGRRRVVTRPGKGNELRQIAGGDRSGLERAEQHDRALPAYR